MNRLSHNGNGKLRFSAADWSGPNTGDKGGVYWQSRKTGEKVYSPTNPGGAEPQGEQKQPAAAKPVDLKATGQKYAQIAREKWGDQAHAKLSEKAAALANDQSPEGQRKLAAVKAMTGELQKGEPSSAKMLEDSSRAAASTESPKTDDSKKTSAAPAPQSGLHPHATIPDRHVRYDNGAPKKIHDLRPGEKNVPEEYFVTDERPGLVRDKDGEVLSLQLNSSTEERFDQGNNQGMRFRTRGDYQKMTIAVRNEYGGYLKSLGEQAVDHESDMTEDESFTPETAKEIATELRGHVDQAKGEIKEWYTSALAYKFGDRFKEYADTVKNDVEDGFEEADQYLDAMEAATDADEFEEAVNGFDSAINEAIDHIDTEADKIDRQLEDEIDAENEAIDTERDRVVDELNELQGTSFEKAKKLAGMHNRQAARNELPYRVKYDPNNDEWYYEEFSMPGAPDRYDADEPARYEAINLDDLRRMPGPEASAYAKGVLAMLARQPSLRREFSLQDLAYLEMIARDVDRYAAEEAGVGRDAYDGAEPERYGGHDVSQEPRDADGKWTTGGASGKKVAPRNERRKNNVMKNHLPISEVDAKEYTATGNAAAFRIHDGKKPLPKKSANMWTDGEDEEMPGTSGYANMTNALSDMLFGERESVTGENYTSAVKGDPHIVVLAGKSVDGPGAEVVVPNARIAATFSREEVVQTFREVAKEIFKEANEPQLTSDKIDAMTPEELNSEVWKFEYDDIKRIANALQAKAANRVKIP